MTETQERFLRTILSRVEAETVVELHLFPPIRRGTLETGVAVIATELPPVTLLMDPEPAVADEGMVDGEAVADTLADVLPANSEVAAETLEAVSGWAQDAIRAVEGGEPGALAERSEHDAIPDEAGVLGHDALPDTQAHGENGAILERGIDVIESDSPYRSDEAAPETDAPVGVVEHDLADMTSDAVAEFAPEPAPAIAMPARRLRILTASYRHTIKGVERGKWTVDVQVEADAPAEAMEAVLRGVRHRSTEPADPELVALDVLTHLVAPATVAPAA